MAAVDLNKNQMLCQQQQTLLHWLKFTRCNSPVLWFVHRMRTVHRNRGCESQTYLGIITAVSWNGFRNVAFSSKRILLYADAMVRYTQIIPEGFGLSDTEVMKNSV